MYIHVGVIFTVDSFENALSLPPILLNEVICTGSEMKLADCAHNNFNVNDCSHSQDIAIQCQRKSLILAIKFVMISFTFCIHTARQCNETEVRLVDGRSAYDGIVELCVGGVWGRICDDEWNTRDATVTCNQLGYTRGIIHV